MYRLLLLALLLPLTACDTDGVDVVEEIVVDESGIMDLSDLSQAPKSVLGTWTWTQSTYFETESGEPEVVTAEASGRTETWMFLTDGRAKQYVNGELVFESDYEVRKRQYPSGTTDPLASIQFADGSYGFDFGTAGDLLVLDDTAVDGGQSLYRKK